MPLTDYSAPFLTPTYMELTRDNPLTLTVYYDGQVCAPVSGTISVYNPQNQAVVNAGAVTVGVDGVASYTVTAPMLTAGNASLGRGYRVEWSLLMDDDYTHVFRNTAAVVRIRHSNPVATGDLLKRHPDLDEYLPSGQGSWQTQLDAVWADTVARLEANAKRPYLITTEFALRPYVLAEALALICLSLSGTGADDNKWSRLAEYYRIQANSAWSDMSFEYDESDTGQSSPNRRTAAVPSIWLARSPGRWT
jgi:hypothetical protein